jgi:hypothetical protein
MGFLNKVVWITKKRDRTPFRSMKVYQNGFNGLIPALKVMRHLNWIDDFTGFTEFFGVNLTPPLRVGFFK